MRLRSLVVLALLAAFIGGSMWFYAQGSDNPTLGSGGLPLIKADVSPIKTPPDDTGGEVMPNADSTVFSAMGSDGKADPSMEDVKLPGEVSQIDTPTASSEFAGLRTGFTLPKEPERKTESLYNQTPTVSGDSKYLSGIAPEAVNAPQESVSEVTQSQAAKIETATSEPEPRPQSKPAAKPELAPAMIADEPSLVPEPLPLPLTDDGNIAAQNLEAEEMAAIRPSVKPPAPIETSAPQIEQEEARAVPKAEKIVRPEDAPYVPPPKQTAITTQPLASSVPSAPKALPTPGKGNYYIQLASAVAGGNAGQDTWRRLQNKYTEALAGITPAFVPATVPGKGDYVRIQAGPFTSEEAKERCEAIRLVDPKGGCLVLRR